MKVANQNEFIMVDDSEEDIFLLRLFYKKSNLENPMKTFSSGESFLEYMSEIRSNASSVPAMVLLDVNMPKLDGYETFFKLKAMEEFKDIPPIIFFTNSKSEVDVEKAERLGAGFKTKPVHPDEYVSFLNSLS